VRLQPAVAATVATAGRVFRRGEWTSIPADEVGYLLADTCPFVLMEERSLGLRHIQYIGKKHQTLRWGNGSDADGKWRVHPGDCISLPRHAVVQLLKRRAEIVYLDPATVLSRSNRVIFIRDGGMGDNLLTLPAIAEVKRRYPHLRIEYATEQRYFELVSRNDFVDEAITIDTAYDRAPYDATFDLKMFCEAAKDSGSVHRAAIFARPFGVELTDYAMPYTVLEDEKVQAGKLVEGLHKPIVAVQAAGSIPRRMTSKAKTAEIAAAMRARGASVVLIDYRRDDAWDVDLNLTGMLNIPEMMAVLDACDFVVAGDSGILHAANALNKRVCGLFGSVDHTLRVKDQLNCRPIQCNDYSGCSICNDWQLKRCKNPDICLDSVPTDLVVQTVLEWQ
jgi:ADP-heptose:LPS heptosyltransferase